MIQIQILGFGVFNVSCAGVSDFALLHVFLVLIPN